MTRQEIINDHRYNTAIMVAQRMHPDWSEEQVRKDVEENFSAYKDIINSINFRDELYEESTNIRTAPRRVDLGAERRALASQRRADEEARIKREEEEINDMDYHLRNLSNSAIMSNGRMLTKKEKQQEEQRYISIYDALASLHPDWDRKTLVRTAYDAYKDEEKYAEVMSQLAASKGETPSTPTVDTSSTEVPKVETTTTVTPSVNPPTVTSTVETPKVNAPTVSTPIVATPKVETPKVETATVEAPVDSAPTVSTSKAETTVASVPTVSAPKVETPQTETPVVSTPKAETPSVEAPKVATPVASAPAVSTPKVETPEVEPVVASTPKVETLSATPSAAKTAATPATTQPTVTQSATPTTVAAPKVETTKSNKNKFQQRIDEQAAAMEKAYADLRDIYDNPTDEQILAVAGNNLRGYQRKMGNKAGNWGTAFGSNAMWGTLNKNTRDALEAGYQAGIEAKKKNLPDKRAESVYTLGEGEGAKKVTKGMQMDARNWGDNIKDTENITPEQVRKLNEIMKTGGFTEFAIPTTQVTTKNEQGEDVVTDVEQNTSLYDLLESATPEEIEALEYLGFIDDYDGSYTRPHNETFDEKLARKEREQARIDLLTQQRALERQRARTGLADLAAGIGDMIKASNGAIVTPRDYQAMYDTLTAQQKVNYNNYLARMQAMKEAEKAKAKEAADRAYNERLLKEKYAREDALLKAAQEREDAQRKQDHEWELEKIRARGENSLRVQKEKNKAILEKFNNERIINFNGVNYTYAKGAKNSVISQLLPIVKPYFNDTNDYKSMLSGIENSAMNEFGKDEEIANLVICAINDPYLYLSEESKAKIVNVLKGLSSGAVSVGTQRNTSAAGSGTSTSGQAQERGQEQGNDGGMFES